MWQDLVIMGANFVFAAILIPQALDLHRCGTCMNLYSTGITAIGLVVISYAFATLDLWASVMASMFNASIWTTLFLISWKNRK